MFFGRTRPETVSKPVFFKKQFFTKKTYRKKKCIRIGFFLDRNDFHLNSTNFNPPLYIVEVYNKNMLRIANQITKYPKNMKYQFQCSKTLVPSSLKNIISKLFQAKNVKNDVIIVYRPVRFSRKYEKLVW